MPNAGAIIPPLRKCSSMYIRETSVKDLSGILAVQTAAFRSDEEATLTRKLLSDPSARPLYSRLAFDGDEPTGHILFTRAYLEQNPEILVYILAPLAVVPTYQGKGVGGALVRNGLNTLAENGVELVFVLGHPEYYPRFGFKVAGDYRLEAPFPIEEKNYNAWMVQSLQKNALDSYSGRIVCSSTLNKPEYWLE